MLLSFSAFSLLVSGCGLLAPAYTPCAPDTTPVHSPDAGAVPRRPALLTR